MPKRSTEAKNLDDDDQKIHLAEQSDKDVSRRKRAQSTAGSPEHSQQQAVKSIANGRLKCSRRTMSRRKKLDR